MFANRETAGNLLGEKLKKYRRNNPIILAIPRGGVIVGAAVAKVLSAPLAPIISRKVRFEDNSELAIGAICDPHQPLPKLADRTVILIDDGIATGYTVKAAIAVIKNLRPKKLILAVPVIPKDSVFEFKEVVDRLVYLLAPEFLNAVGDFYTDFTQVTDEEVAAMLPPLKNSP